MFCPLDFLKVVLFYFDGRLCLREGLFVYFIKLHLFIVFVRVCLGSGVTSELPVCVCWELIASTLNH